MKEKPDWRHKYNLQREFRCLRQHIWRAHKLTSQLEQCELDDKCRQLVTELTFCHYEMTTELNLMLEIWQWPVRSLTLPKPPEGPPKGKPPKWKLLKPLI
jgi:hypothetical protein